ncbi:hypothetical protein [Campylobacter fetus]|uniref:Uncharacterized protein n=1 Tax=Campylobacter fetus subsp. venerealis NCTC 10354 TaxID=983328 RepID=A0AAE6M9M0_CAMFE|nr:hypothetical protein [Campylobacter fetus]EAK0834474.1 hypothetical protein [Campylobacter fetus]EGU23577.1 hypothetical protein CFV354_0481 [Campylobacter fetus subsp. venerealis NCTC 10354]QEL44401.1 hypothetical protein CFVT_0417 [Campylobacter fetus subsp. venerealis NCTC 10354]
MKVSQAYSIIALIFANNFAKAMNEENLKKLTNSWVIKTENIENEKGLELWQKALQTDDTNSIESDLASFGGACVLKFFKQVSEEKVDEFYKSINFNKPFKELKSSHISNMLALLSAILKNDTNDKSHALLGLYLSEYLLPITVLFAKFIRYNAKTYYYKALGEFLIDYCKILKSTLGLRMEIE